jgi:HPt (histidine-containing phosphotransfer) domain-containing protein
LSATGAAAAVKTRLAELTGKFVSRTGDDVAQMREALARLDAGHGGDDGSALAQIHQLAHRACGTGGTLGLCAFSDAAADLERLIEAFPAGAILSVAERARLAAGIEAIAAQLALL